MTASRCQWCGDPLPERYSNGEMRKPVGCCAKAECRSQQAARNGRGWRGFNLRGAGQRPARER